MRRTLALVAFVGCVGLAGPAAAAPLDFQLVRLTPSDQLQPGPVGNRNFRIFANQLGAAISSASFEPPGTLGQNGFNVGFGYTSASVDTRQEIWPTSGNAGSTVRMPTLFARKGLPQSFELGARYAYLEQSSMSAASFHLKWSPMEGIEPLPDLSARLHVTRLFGARDFGLVTGGVDLAVGKTFSLFEFVTATPYAGWDVLMVNANSGIIDFNSKRTFDDATKEPTKDTFPYDLVTLQDNISHRFYLGLRLVRSIVDLGCELSWVKPLGSRTMFASSLKLGLDF